MCLGAFAHDSKIGQKKGQQCARSAVTPQFPMSNITAWECSLLLHSPHLSFLGLYNTIQYNTIHIHHASGVVALLIYFCSFFFLFHGPRLFFLFSFFFLCIQFFSHHLTFCYLHPTGSEKTKIPFIKCYIVDFKSVKI